MGDKTKSPVVPTGAAKEYNVIQDNFVDLNDPVWQTNGLFQAVASGSAWPAFVIEYAKTTQEHPLIVQAVRGGSTCSEKANTDYGFLGNHRPPLCCHEGKS